jgi:tetratricopeptide (TPR) repeat protein
MIRGAVAMQSGNATKAIEALALGAPYELGETVWLDYLRLYLIYLRGQAYLATHQGSPAAEEFQKILNHAGLVVNEPIGSLAHLGLGRAYAMAGDSTKAKTAYQDFLGLWKDADPDIPILKQAKVEYAKLQ